MVSRPSAPGPLALVEAFLRTRNEVTDLAGLERWRHEHGVPGRMTEYARALKLREALRALMCANNGGPAAPEAVDLVNAEIEACDLRPAISPDGSLRVRSPEDATGDMPLLRAVLGGVLTAMADGTWPRMKACAADDCHYAFYDHTRNRSGRWCDVAGCGANARMRAYRRRLARP
jgi:predicted RNA-binding Zn ribbon-like protein